MKIETVSVAKALAQRFIAKAKAVEDRAKVERGIMYGCKETGDLRRASMDLTRILAEMRRGRT